MLLIKVTISQRDGTLYCQYVMNHDNPSERKVLGEQCRNAFEAGQSVSTSPYTK